MLLMSCTVNLRIYKNIWEMCVCVVVVCYALLLAFIVQSSVMMTDDRREFYELFWHGSRCPFTNGTTIPFCFVRSFVWRPY
jgi:hypothetical protein